MLLRAAWEYVMGAPRSMTPEQTQRARAMLNAGRSTREVADFFGCHAQTIRRYLDPKYRETRIAQIRRNREGVEKIAAKAVHGGPLSAASLRADAERRMAEIPADTRSLTGRMLGDPLFERSALYRKMTGI